MKRSSFLPKPHNSSRNSAHRFGLVFLVIVLLVVADTAAIGFALNGNRAFDVAASPGEIPSFAPSVSPSISATPLAQPSAALPPTRIIAALDGATAWRVLTGDCPAGAASPELTTDSAATWAVTNTTASTKVTALQRIIVTGPASATMIGLSAADCTPQLIKTSASGKNYVSFNPELPSAWYLDPASRAELHSPTGQKPAPCNEVIALAPRTARAAAVLCSDHTVSVTADAAATWSQPRKLDGAGNIAAAGLGYVVAASSALSSRSAPSPSCVGLLLLTISTDVQTTTATGCLPLGASLMPKLSEVALSVAASNLWVWAGSTLQRSTDAGVTWR